MLWLRESLLIMLVDQSFSRPKAYMLIVTAELLTQKTLSQLWKLIRPDGRSKLSSSSFFKAFYLQLKYAVLICQTVVSTIRDLLSKSQTFALIMIFILRRETEVNNGCSLRHGLTLRSLDYFNSRLASFSPSPLTSSPHMIEIIIKLIFISRRKQVMPTLSYGLPISLHGHFLEWKIVIKGQLWGLMRLDLTTRILR